MNKFKAFLGKIYNEGTPWYNCGILLMILAYFLMMLGSTLGLIIVSLVFRTQLKNDTTGFWAIFGQYATFIGIWIIYLLYYLTKKNRPLYKSVWTAPKGNNVKFLLLGLLIGFGCNAICAVTAMINKDIAIYFDRIAPVELIAIFIAVFIQSSAEELVCRNFLYNRFRKTFKHPAVAIILNSLFFALLHVNNHGVGLLALVDIFITGIFFSFMVYYMDSLWCAMAVHAAWNYTQNIIFGLPNSGIVSPFSIFRLDAAAAKSSFVYNVDFGLEGTIFACLVMALGALVIYLIYRNKNVTPYNPWNQPKPEPKAEEVVKTEGNDQV